MKKLLAFAFLSLSLNAAELTVSWDDNSTNEDGFEVSRALSPSLVFTPLPVTPSNTTSYVDVGLLNNTGYSYRVRAFINDPRGIIYSAYSNIASGTTYPVLPTINAPGNAKVKASGLSYIKKHGKPYAANEN